ncbi:MAG: peptidase C39 [Burkholderiales bacterium]|nr:MAG: peptidase C39 [Burkholderiales bacterium]
MMRAALIAALALTATPSALAQVRFGNEAGGVSQINVMTYRDIPFRTVVRQEYDYSCGSAALATLLTYHYGQKRSEAEIFKAMYEVGDQARIQSQGFSLLEMKLYLDQQGYTSDGFKLTFDRFAQLNTPAIAMIETKGYRHFVVVKGVDGDRILIGDPTHGLKTYTRPEFERIWNGIAFVIRDHRTESLFNNAVEWRPYAPTPWSTARSAVLLDQARSIDPLYQIAPITDLNAVLP